MIGNPIFIDLFPNIPHKCSAPLEELYQLSLVQGWVYFHYGSYVKLTQNIYSDVDIGVILSKNSENKLVRWKQKWEQSGSLWPISVKSIDPIILTSSEALSLNWTRLATAYSPMRADLSSIQNKVLVNISTSSKNEIRTRLRRDLTEFKKEFHQDHQFLASISWHIVHAAPILKFVNKNSGKCSPNTNKLSDLIIQCTKLERDEKKWIEARAIKEFNNKIRPFESDGALKRAQKVRRYLQYLGE